MSDSNYDLDEIIKKCEKIQKNAENSIKASNSLPCSDFVLYQSYSGFSKVMEHESKTIIQLLQALAKDEKIQNKSLIKASTEEKFDMIVEINDSVLDRVGNLLDEAEGLKKKNEDLIIATLNVPSFNRKQNRINLTKWNERSTKSKEEQITKLFIRKPQLDFEDKIDNFKAFEPIIKFKHNSIKPLSIVKQYDNYGEVYYPNPYEIEITNYKLLEMYLKEVQPKKPERFEETYFKFIEKEEDLNEILEYLKNVEEFAVDLEYHSQRSFLGFTCLIQISTRDKDFIIDTIKLRSKMHILNEVFTDPKILKVFHGADLDVRWLQKDFGIYVVNMFDTGKAAKLLQFPSFSLAFLVKHYCNEVLAKKYQLADWRIRPLTKGMLNYARSDTHNLLYIFDRMRNDLIKKEGVQLLIQAFENSRKVCLAQFEIPILNENSYLALLRKNRVDFNNRQQQAFKDMHLWRDNLARTEDECTNYILPNHMMLKIAEVLPQEQQGILACCNPIPVMVKKHLTELHLIVLKARELPLKKLDDNVYLLKPITNQIVDITSNMDLLDEEQGDEHHLVNYDCLLDTPEMMHKIKFSKSATTDKDNSMLINFLAFKSDSKNVLFGQSKTPFEKYLKAIEIRKMNGRTNEEKESKNKSEIDINQVPEIVSKVITNEPVKIEDEKMENLDQKEEELTKRLEKCPLIDINKKKKRQKFDKPDIPYEVNESISNLISNSMNANKNEEINEKTIEGKDKSNNNDQFEYNQADYSIFSTNSQQNNYFDPSKKFLNKKQRNKSFNSRTKRKRDFYISSSSTFQPNKRSK